MNSRIKSIKAKDVAGRTPVESRVAAPPGRAGRRCLSSFNYVMLGMLMAFLGISSSVSASHYMGGQISYVSLGNNVYRVTKSIYRDCAGATIGTSSSIQVTPTNAGSFFNLPRISFADITPLCPGQVSRCVTGSGVYGVEEYIFRSDITLPPLVNGGNYTLSAVLCCRNNAINTLQGAGGQQMYLSTTLNPNLTPQNSSPTFLNRPVAFLCVNQPATISPNAFDPDGDALVYSLTACRDGSANDPVSYLGGFSATNPLTSSTPITINPNNGELSFTPSVVNQVAVVCIRAQEFRNGVQIGEIVRDIQIRVLNCSNQPPVVSVPSNVFVNVGQTYCANVGATDADNNNITLTATSGIIPPATFTLGSSGAGFANGTFCFTPSAIHEGNTYTVTINAQDNGCPAPATGVGTFNITIPAQCRVDASATSTSASCGAANGSATGNLTDGTPPYQFNWTGPNGYTGFGQTISNIVAGTYCVTIIDGNGCVDSTCVVVPSAGGSINVTATAVNANCGQSNGSITATATGGNVPYQFSLNGGAFQASNTFTGLGQGTYVVTGMDITGCTGSVTVVVGQAADTQAPSISCPGNISVGNDPGQCGAAVSFAAATATDDCSTPAVAQTAGPASGSFFGLGNTTVSFTATDGAGNSASCSFTVNVIDNQAPAITCPANISVNNDPGVCGAAVSFSATATDNCPGVTTAQSSGLSSGSVFPVGASSVSFTATDASGNTALCSFSVSVTDNQAPNAICRNVIVNLDGSGNASITANDVNNGSNDNCGIASISVSPTSFNCSQVASSTQDLFISEYIEGSGNNKCIEIFNGTGAAVNLSGYALAIYFNGAFFPTMINLSGTVANGDVYVICNPQATVAFTAQADALSGSISHNGNDAVVLTKNGNQIDIMGRIGENPGTAWVVGGNSTLDRTLVRNGSVMAGNTANAPGFPSLGTEWTSFANNTASNLGSHSLAGSPTATLTVTDIYGNSSTCTANVTVLDNVAPNAVCQNITVQLDATGNATITPAHVDGGSTDNCGIASLSLNNNAFDCSDIGGTGINELFISQYIEGSGNNKCIEIYNGTGAAVNLSGYQLFVYFNGATTATTTINLAGSVAAGDVWVVCNTTAAAGFLAQTDQTTGANLFNGDDAVVLAKNGTPIDIIGRIGEDPGTAWTGAGNSTLDRTLERNSNVTLGNTSNASGFPSLATEWTGSPIDALASLGSHSVSSSGLSVILTVTDVNGNSSTCNASVTVQDNIAPTAICQDLTVQLDATGNASITAAQVDNGSSDNCAIASLSVSPNTFNCSDVGGDLPTDLFISEYVEGSSFNKCIEIYNGTGSTVNLAAYEIRMYFNGSTTPAVTVPLVGSLASGDVWVVCQSLASLTFRNLADQLSGSATWYNGNDAVALVKNNTTVIDLIGRIGEDPGTAWTGGGNSTVNRSLMRNANIAAGNTANATGFPSLATEWTSFPQDFSANLGSHSFTPSGVNGVTLTVTDVNGNSSTCTANVTVQDNVAPVALCQSLTINIGSTGSVTVPAGAIDNGSSDACGIASTTLSPSTFTCDDLGANTVTLTVTDVNGNTSTCTATVTVTNDPLTASLASPTFQCGYNVTCNGSTDGSIDGTVAGGCQPYSYAWSNGATTEDLSGLGAGTYTLTVTDVNGNSTTAAVTLTQPDPLTISLSSPTFNGGWNISCNGNNDGSIDATTAGGASCQAYAYNWSGPNGFTSNVEDPSLLYAGTYSVTVMDANGCTATASITLTEPPVLTNDAGNNVTVYYGYTQQYNCTTLNGTATGGTQPYSGTWTANGSTVGTGFSVTVCPTTSTTYYFTVVDANGCTTTDSVRVCVIDVRCVGISNNGSNGNNTGGQGGQGSNNGNAPQHVTVCHIPPGQPQNAMTKCLPPSAIPLHLAHGDYLGECGSNTVACTFPTGTVRTAGSSAASAEEELLSDIRMSAFPNPTNGQVKVELSCTLCGDFGKFEVKVVSLYGQTLKTASIDMANGEGMTQFDLSGYATGFYFIVVENGEHRLVEKVMKN